MSNNTTPFSVTVNTDTKLSISPATIETLDWVEDADNTLHILHNNKAYAAEVIDTDFEQKIFEIKVNGNLYSVKIADQYDRLIQDIGLTAGQNQKVNNVKSPMPGLVLSLNAAVGDTIVKGDTLLILEAMKMENLIKATTDVTIKAIHVSQGQAVVKGQLLVEFV